MHNPYQLPISGNAIVAGYFKGASVAFNGGTLTGSSTKPYGFVAKLSPSGVSK